MDKKNKKLSEFEKLFAKTGINIDEVLSQKGLLEDPILKKEFKPIYLDKEELREETFNIAVGYKGQGVQQNILDKLMKTKRNYEFKEGRIDLHGENTKTAQTKINTHLEKCYKMGIKNLLIITGKGSAETLSPLKKLVFVMLKKSSIVEAVCYAKNHGGTGAFYVRIRN